MNTKLLLVVSLAAIAGCATIPAGPNVVVMPAAGKPFEVFVADDSLCRRFAELAPLRERLVAGCGSRSGDWSRRAWSGRSSWRREWPSLRLCRGRECRVRRGFHPATALRHRLHAMHVCQGESGSGCGPDRFRTARVYTASSASSELQTGTVTYDGISHAL